MPTMGRNRHFIMIAMYLGQRLTLEFSGARRVHWNELLAALAQVEYTRYSWLACRMATYASQPKWLRETTEYKSEHKRHDEKEPDAIARACLTF